MKKYLSVFIIMTIIVMSAIVPANAASYNVTIHYQDLLGSQIAPDDQVSVDDTVPSTITAPAKDGYDYRGSETDVPTAVTIANGYDVTVNGDGSITFRYWPTDLPNNYARITYHDDQGNAIKPEDIVPVNDSTETLITPPVIDGYTVTNATANVVGTYTVNCDFSVLIMSGLIGEGNTIDFVYQVMTSIITVSYQDSDGNTIAPDDTVNMVADHNTINISPKPINGYMLSGVTYDLSTNIASWASSTANTDVDGLITSLDIIAKAGTITCTYTADNPGGGGGGGSGSSVTIQPQLIDWTPLGSSSNDTLTVGQNTLTAAVIPRHVCVGGYYFDGTDTFYTNTDQLVINAVDGGSYYVSWMYAEPVGMSTILDEMNRTFDPATKAVTYDIAVITNAPAISTAWVVLDRQADDWTAGMTALDTAIDPIIRYNVAPRNQFPQPGIVQQDLTDSDGNKCLPAGTYTITPTFKTLNGKPITKAIIYVVGSDGKYASVDYFDASGTTIDATFAHAEQSTIIIKHNSINAWTVNVPAGGSVMVDLTYGDQYAAGISSMNYYYTGNTNNAEMQYTTDDANQNANIEWSVDGTNFTPIADQGLAQADSADTYKPYATVDGDQGFLAGQLRIRPTTLPYMDRRSERPL